MIQQEKELHKFLIRNSLICWACVAVTLGSIITCFYVISQHTKESREYLYMIRENGDIVPMEWVNRRDNIEIEAKHHLQMLSDNLYSINQFNWKEKVVNKGFWLGDMEQFHKNRVSKGYYNIFIGSNVEQEAQVLPGNIELVKNGNGWDFYMTVDMVRKYSEKEKKSFSVFVKGRIQEKTRNFPNNPHGMWVTNFIEEKLIEHER